MASSVFVSVAVSLIVGVLVSGAVAQKTVVQQPPTTPKPLADKDVIEDWEKCDCVMFYLCDINQRIRIYAEGLLDPKQEICEEDEVCCYPPKNVTLKPSDDRTREPKPRPDTPPESTPGSGPIEPPLPEVSAATLTVPEQPAKAGCGFRRNIPNKKKRNPLDPRIAGVNDQPVMAGFGEYPWMSVLFKRVNGVNRFVCGASLIHPQVVVTAAHCITKQIPGTEVEGLGEFRIRAGEWDLANTEEPLTHQERSVLRLIVHPEYNNETLFNDIALIVLDSPMDINPTVDTVCLADANAAFTRTNTSACIVTGWGKNQFEGGRHQKILREVTLSIVDRGECQERLRKTRLGKYFVLHETFICAGGSPEEDSCDGDGGGPLVCPILTDPSRFVQIGMVSWGVGCANNNPGVYVSVPNYFSWISTSMLGHVRS